MANVPLLNEPNYTNGGMTFLQMVQRLAIESGSSGSVPATTIGQTGMSLRLVNWIASAWQDIQNEKQDWFFMRQPVSFNTVAGQQSYTAAQAGIASFANYKLNSFRQYRVSMGYGSEQKIGFLNYDTFRDLYQYATMRTTSQMPVAFTIDPQKNFLLGPIPDDIYTINGEGYALPTLFSTDADTTTMPHQYDMAVVWKALVYYGTYESAAESVMRGTAEYTRLMDKLYVDQSPAISFGPSLA